MDHIKAAAILNRLSAVKLSEIATPLQDALNKIHLFSIRQNQALSILSIEARQDTPKEDLPALDFNQGERLIVKLECNERECGNKVAFFLVESKCYPWETNSFYCKDCIVRFIGNHLDKVFTLQRVDFTNVQELIQREKDNRYQPEEVEQKTVNGL